MNKIILALIAVVFVIGAALVVFNQQQTPEPQVAAERALPTLPAPEPAPLSGDLQPLPKLPAPIANDGASVRAPVQEQTGDDQAGVDNSVQPKISVFVRENGVTVRVQLPATIRYKKLRLSNPERIAVDLEGIFRALRVPGVPENPLVSNVRLGFQANNMTRVVVDLKDKPRRERITLSEDMHYLDIRVDQ